MFEMKQSIYRDMMQQTHVLIAGQTGCGKSTVVNNLIKTAVKNPVESIGLVCIDLKMVELQEWRDDVHCLAYADNIESTIAILERSIEIIMDRFKRMQSHGVKKWTGQHVYIIIDELADLMTVDRKRVQPLIQRIGQIGRAAGFHMICCTQCPLVKIIPTEIKVAFTAILGLHTRNARDSRNIIDCPGCERLPPYGEGYYLTPAITSVQRVKLPLLT